MRRMRKEKKPSLFAEILGAVTKYFLIAVGAVVLLIALSGVRVIESGNVAIVLRFGKLVGESYDEQVHEPGLLFAFPYIIDEVVTVPTGSVIEQTVSTHYTSGEMTTLRQNGYVVTADQNIAVVRASVKYMITDPVAYALRVADIPSLIDATVGTSMVSTAAGMSVDDLLTSGKDDFSRSVLTSAQAKLSAAGAGITLGTIELTDVGMPAEVRDTYNEVNSATVRASTMLEEAKKYRETLIPSAEATAAKLKNDAASAYSSAIATANNELSEFRGVLDEYKQNPELVKIRLYNSKLSEAVSKIGKVRVVGGGESKIFIFGE